MPGRRPGPGGQPAGDPGAGLGRPPVRADQGAGRARGRAPPQAWRAGADRSRVRQGLPPRRPVMIRRIVLTMLLLVSVLLVTAVAPLGLLIAGREQDSFRMETVVSAQTLALAAEKGLSDHSTGRILEKPFVQARAPSDEVWVFNARARLIARFGAAKREDVPVPPGVVSGVLRRDGNMTVTAVGGEMRVTLSVDGTKSGRPGGALVLARPMGELNDRL